MGKKSTSNSTNLGRAVIKARENIPAAKRKRAAKLAKNAGGGEIDVNKALDDDLPEKNMCSVLEQNSLDDFLAKAQLAGTEFTAERVHLSLVDAGSNKLIGITSEQDEEKIKFVQEKYKNLLTIPRRPVWTEEMSGKELQKLEVERFLEWRRKLAELQEVESLVLTPFERNIEIWRQLWRVLERSDVVMQILDARNPLLFRNEDLEAYVEELSSTNKLNVLLMNKADLLNQDQRQAWVDYFDRSNVRVVFWSALEEKHEKPVEEDLRDIAIKETSMQSESENESGCEDDNDVHQSTDVIKETVSEESENNESESENDETESEYEDDTDDDKQQYDIDDNKVEDSVQRTPSCRIGDNSVSVEKCVNATHPTSTGLNSSQLLTRDELIDYLKGLQKFVKPSKNDVFTIGLVGYPNVGKSSTINKLMGKKKVGVSATPGKTKHFQTLFLEDDLMLCDCPGLVMPSFAMSKEQMMISSILSADQMREYNAPVGLICSQIPRVVFERLYGVTLPLPDAEVDDITRAPTASELLTMYAFVRGFMSPKGVPDWSRAARVIIKDYVSGKLLYCLAPPGVNQATFNDYEKYTSRQRRVGNEELNIIERRHLLNDKIKPKDVDRTFFASRLGSAHVKSSKKSNAATDAAASSKPWRKHNNKNKKEKLRRIYGHLDA